jgi:hypothetical protein
MVFSTQYERLGMRCSRKLDTIISAVQSEQQRHVRETGLCNGQRSKKRTLSRA